MMNEPWSVEKYGDYPGRKAVVDNQGETVILGLTYTHKPHHEDDDADSEHLRRIVACINFFQGIPTDQVERLVICGGKVVYRGEGVWGIEFPMEEAVGK